MKRKAAIRRIQEIVGREHNLHDLATRYGIPVRRNGRVNKGWAGHVLERHLGIPINSSQAPNFGSWELKVVPVKRLKSGKLVFKETMAVTMIDPRNIIQTPFRDSHLLLKLRKILMVARFVGETVDEVTYVHDVAGFDLSGKLYKAVEEDYNLVRRVLDRDNESMQNLTGKMGTYIQPRTKGQGHGSQTRAFYARKCFLEHVFDLSC